MQRLAAMVLLSVFAWLAGAPLSVAFEAPESTLPACCRAAGAHHCSMKGAPGHVHTASFTSGRCRTYPRHPSALLQLQAIAPSSGTRSIALPATPFVTAGALESYAEARRNRAPRGPPSLRLS